MKGVVGYVVIIGEILNIVDVYYDERFNRCVWNKYVYLNVLGLCICNYIDWINWIKII